MRGYSGRGPTEACIMKPEVVAPEQRLSAVSGWEMVMR